MEHGHLGAQSRARPARWRGRGLCVRLAIQSQCSHLLAERPRVNDVTSLALGFPFPTALLRPVPGNTNSGPRAFPKVSRSDVALADT